MNPILKVNSVTKSFDGVRALNDLTLELKPALRFWGIIGPNGSGKTSLLNCIAGLHAPDTGTIHLGEERIDGLSTTEVARLGLGRTFQQPRLFPQLTVIENLVAIASGSARVDRAADLLDLVGLGPSAFVRVDELSGGQQKIVEVLRVLMLEPILVLLDEFGAGVHPSIVEILVGYLRHVSSTGVRFLLVEHDMRVIEQLCDWVFVLDQGALVHDGLPAEVLSSRVLEDVYFRGASHHVK